MARFVLDASAALAIGAADGFGRLDEHELHAPHLLRSETAAAIRQQEHRGTVSERAGDRLLERVLAGSIHFHGRGSLVRDATRLARDRGWAKTYDAEYLALARALRCPVLSIDRRLARGSGPGEVIGLEGLPESHRGDPGTA